MKLQYNPNDYKWLYLVALRATITLTYVPVMTPGLYDTFPANPETFPGHIGWFPGPFLVKIWSF